MADPNLGRFADPNAPNTYRSSRVAAQQAKVQQARQQAQQAQAAAPTATKAKKRAPATKTAASTSGVKKAAPKGKAARATGKKATKAPAAKKAAPKNTAPKKTPGKKAVGKKKVQSAVEQESDEEEAIPDQDEDEAAPDPALSTAHSGLGEDEQHGEDGEAAAAAAATRQQQEEIAQAAQPTEPSVTHEEVEEAVDEILQGVQNQTAQPAAPPITHEREPAPVQVRLSYPDHGEDRELLANNPLNKQAFLAVQFELEYSGVQWIHAGQIGEGSFGRANLYVQVDPAGNILQRMVVKTVLMPHSAWIQARQWHVDERDPIKKEHMEIEVMEAIANVEGTHKCVRLRHFTTHDSKFMYCLYTGYHPRGDLSDLTKHTSRYQGTENFIPEPVLWKWLEDLTEASLLLSKGAAPPSDAVEGWKKIVHCDFKPANVFLDNPDAELWRSYPQAVVGDFGLAVFTDEHDPFNPTWYNAYGIGTAGWRPPEQMMMVHSESQGLADTGKFGDASNVWGIGAIIMRLMNREMNPMQPRYDADVKIRMVPQLFDSAREVYSKYLCDLVDECVRFRTYYRTELPDLWEKIARYTGKANVEYDPEIDGDDEEFVEALKQNILEQKYGEGNDACRLVYAKEKYRIGMAINDQGEQSQDNQDQDDDNGLGDNSQQGGVMGLLNELNNGLDMDDEDMYGGALDEELGKELKYPGGARTLDEDYNTEEDQY